MQVGTFIFLSLRILTLSFNHLYFLLQGHMYLFIHYICFYSNIFGYETKVPPLLLSSTHFCFFPFSSSILIGTLFAENYPIC